MEDKIYSFHLHASCEDVESGQTFSYVVQINFNEIIINTSPEKSTYHKTPQDMIHIEEKLIDEEKVERIRNLKFQNKVNVRIEDGKYKIV